MSKISVAMATYNGANFIREQLCSIASQTFPPSELIVSDDGSKDATLDIIEKFARSAPFEVKLFRNEQQLGYKKNFMKCANLCSGDLIAFSDQDDIWSDGKLERQLSHFNEADVFLSCHNVRMVDRLGKDLNHDYSQFKTSGTLGLYDTDPFAYSQGFTQVFRKELLSFSRYWDVSIDHHLVAEPMAHDEWFFFLSMALGRVRYTSDILAYYRQHERNASGAKKQNSASAKIIGTFQNRSEQYHRLALGAENRAKILGAMADNIGVEFGQSAQIRLTTASRQYLALSATLYRRLNVDNAGSFRGRCIALMAALLRGDYSLKNRWKSSLFGLMRDFIVVFLRRAQGG